MSCIFQNVSGNIFQASPIRIKAYRTEIQQYLGSLVHYDPTIHPQQAPMELGSGVYAGELPPIIPCS